jgi:hypothetical protein
MKTRNNEKMRTDSILSVFIFLKTGCSTFESAKTQLIDYQHQLVQAADQCIFDKL